VVIPIGTQVSGEVQLQDAVIDLVFTTDAELTLTANGTGTVVASHGELIGLREENVASAVGDVDGESLGFSDATPSQRFELSETAVVEDSIQVYVESGGSFELWERVPHLIDFGPTDAVYEVLVDADDVQFIVFGDGISGAIPNNLAEIKANYILGGGSIGNISPDVLDTVIASPGFSAEEIAALADKVTVTNSISGTGGSDPESDELIRRLAPQALTALNRAVSLTDYESLSLAVSGVGKAKAIGSTRTSVTVYVSPLQSDDATDFYPGLLEDPEEGTELIPRATWYDLANRVEEFLAGKTQVGVTTTILPPTYTRVNVQIEYTKQPIYSSSQVETQIKSTIRSLFGYNQLNFNEVLRPEELEFELNRLTLVRSAKVTALYKENETVARNTLFGNAGEIFVFGDTSADPDTILVEEASDNAGLTGVTLSSGSLTPVFNTDVLVYSVSVANNVSSITFTAVPADTGATVYINGTLSGTSGTAIALAVGPNVVQVVVYAANAQDTTTYQVSVTRAAA
jgi:predicted phage baseplate assembly protein